VKWNNNWEKKLFSPFYRYWTRIISVIDWKKVTFCYATKQNRFRRHGNGNEANMTNSDFTIKIVSDARILLYFNVWPHSYFMNGKKKTCEKHDRKRTFLSNLTRPLMALLPNLLSLPLDPKVNWHSALRPRAMLRLLLVPCGDLLSLDPSVLSSSLMYKQR